MSKPTRFTDGEFTGDLHVGGNLTVDGTYPSGGGGGILVVHDTDGTLDKTYAEIKAAGVAVIDAGAKEEWNGAYRYYWVVEYAEYTEDNSTEYVINATGVDYSLAQPGFISYLAENEDGYPMLI